MYELSRAMEIKTQMKTLATVKQLNPTKIYPFDGYDKDFDDSGKKVYGGLGTKLRELQAHELNKAFDAAQENIKAWEDVLTSVRSAVTGNTDRVQLKKLRNTTNKTFKNAQKFIGLKEQRHNLDTPFNRDDELAADVEAWDQNLREVSDSFKNRNLNVKINRSAITTDKRSTDTINSVETVEMFKEIKEVNPSSILSDNGPRFTEDGNIDLDSLYKDANTEGGVYGNLQYDLVNNVNNGNKQKVSNALYKMQKIAKRTTKASASSIGRENVQEKLDTAASIGDTYEAVSNKMNKDLDMKNAANAPNQSFINMVFVLFNRHLVFFSSLINIKAFQIIINCWTGFTICLSK